jgi:hypothetical protein
VLAPLANAAEVHVLHLIPEWRRAVAEVRGCSCPGVCSWSRAGYWNRSECNGPRSLARKRHNDILAEWGLVPERGSRPDDRRGSSTAGAGQAVWARYHMTVQWQAPAMMVRTCQTSW